MPARHRTLAYVVHTSLRVPNFGSPTPPSRNAPAQFWFHLATMTHCSKLSPRTTLIASPLLARPIIAPSDQDFHTYIHICMHACIHTYIHTCIHTCMRTYMHTYRWVPVCSRATASFDLPASLIRLSIISSFDSLLTSNERLSVGRHNLNPKP